MGGLAFVVVVVAVVVLVVLVVVVVVAVVRRRSSSMSTSPVRRTMADVASGSPELLTAPTPLSVMMEAGAAAAW